MQPETFYGQCKEDEYISKFFSPTHVGSCIEVGAYNGVDMSNTYYFEKKGWNTLCIEPNPEPFKICQSCRKNCYNCCIGESDNGEQDFTVYKFTDNSTSAISSLVPDCRLVSKLSYLIKKIEKVKVPVRSLTSLLDELNFPKEIDFVSIDTENTELDVLKGIDFDKYKIKMFIVENNYDEPFCQNYLITKGYNKINRISVNDFYVRTF